MSKRFIFPQQQGERKKAKLDVTISDHNFPLSQNPGQDSNQDNWGDDNDDEILLLASQACEQAYNNDISSLPDYSLCMQPKSTSTQINDPNPSTSNLGFAFKKPSMSVSNSLSTNLKNKYSMISLPLPGMSSRIQSSNIINDDLNFNDKVYKGQDSDQLYRQLLQIQVENAKLKSENGKLLEKCVTKEGEASILRTQLKTCQIAVDNARLEKIKAQEKVQMEWTDKLSAANVQLHDLRTQLDFKNLEIISIKEKCKKLESSKIRLTQVTIGNNDISLSHRNNNSITQNDSFPQQRRVITTHSATQTTTAKEHFLKLNKNCLLDRTDLTEILPLIHEPTAGHHSILEYNEKLQKHTDSQNKCRVYSTFHRLPSTPAPSKEIGRNKVVLANVYEDLSRIAACSHPEDLVEKCCNVFKAVKSVLQEVQSELEIVSQRATTAFQKEMDEKYIEAASNYLHVEKLDLLMGRSLYKEEQAMLARRMLAVVAHLLQNTKVMDVFIQTNIPTGLIETLRPYQFLDVVQRICTLLDDTSCATLYSGLLLSTTALIQKIHHVQLDNIKMNILKAIISSRAMSFVACDVLNVMRKIPDELLKKLCPGAGAGNLKVDYDQGVLLFKKDSCYLQVLLKQIEAALKCMEKQGSVAAVTVVTRNLIGIYSNMNVDHSELNSELGQNKCDCHLVFLQVIVYALKICAVMLKNNQYISESSKQDLIATCRSGTLALPRGAVMSAPHSAAIAGALAVCCERAEGGPHGELYANMLSEISAMFHPSPEDMPASYHRQAWINSFQNFSMTD